MTKLTTIFITILAVILLGLMVIDEANGQERTLLYEYNNTQIKDLGSGKKQLTMEMSTPYRLYEHGDTLINVSSHGTIKEVIKGKSNQKINKLGRGASFEHLFDIDADSFITDLEGSDFDVSIDADTVFFKKDGRLVATKIGLKVFDDLDNKLVIDKIEKVGKKIKYKYKRPDKTKKAKIDPTWSWQPDSLTTGYDASIEENNNTFNMGNYTTLYFGSYTPANEWNPIIKFSALGDSIAVNDTINNAYIIFTVNTTAGTPPTVCSTFVVQEVWIENEVTYDVYSTGNNWQISGATGATDIQHSVVDITTGLTWSGTDSVDITNCITNICGTASIWDNNGLLIRPNVVSGTNYGLWYSSEFTTTGSRPIIYIDYTVFVPDTVVYSGVLRDSMDVLRAEWKADIMDSIVAAMANWQSDISDSLQSGSVLFADSARAAGVSGAGITAAAVSDSIQTVLKLTAIPDSINPYITDSIQTVLKLTAIPDSINPYITDSIQTVLKLTAIRDSIHSIMIDSTIMPFDTLRNQFRRTRR